jgi:hypothetical protein
LVKFFGGFMQVSEKRAARQQANLELVGILKVLVESYPDLRFAQILSSYGFVTREGANYWVNEYYMEPVDLLERVKKESTPV